MEAVIKYQHVVGCVTTDNNYLNWWQQGVFWLWKQLTRFCHYRLHLPTTTQISDSVECDSCGARTALPHQGYRIVFQSIATSRPVANAMCAAGGGDWFENRLPVDVSLLPSEVGTGATNFPYAEKARNFTREPDLPIVCPNTGQLCHAFDDIRHSELESVLKQAQALVAQ